MAMRIRITGIEAIDATKERLRQVIGAAILDLDDALKRQSPVALVDGGTFRNSWQAQADGQPSPREGAPGPDAGNAADAAVIFSGIGGVVSIVNSADYAVPLAEGHSKQAPAGWVEAAASKLQDYVDVHVMQSRAADGK